MSRFQNRWPNWKFPEIDWDTAKRLIGNFWIFFVDGSEIYSSRRFFWDTSWPSKLINIFLGGGPFFKNPNFGQLEFFLSDSCLLAWSHLIVYVKYCIIYNIVLTEKTKPIFQNKKISAIQTVETTSPEPFSGTPLYIWKN